MNPFYNNCHYHAEIGGCFIRVFQNISYCSSTNTLVDLRILWNKVLVDYFSIEILRDAYNIYVVLVEAMVKPLPQSNMNIICISG